jgi:hypothetical protein
MTRSRELLNEGGRQNDHIAGCAIQQLLLHQTHGTKGAREVGCQCLLSIEGFKALTKP